MRTSFFAVALSLCVSVLATPGDLYRGDSRSPTTIKNGGGFKAKGFSNPLPMNQATLFDHVEGSLDDEDRDPFISTTSDKNEAAKAGSGVYVYTIESSKVHHKIWDVAEEYKKAGKKYPYPEDKEFSVELEIPWDAITKIEKKNGNSWENVPPPHKRDAGYVETAFEA